MTEVTKKEAIIAREKAKSNKEPNENFIEDSDVDVYLSSTGGNTGWEVVICGGSGSYKILACKKFRAAYTLYVEYMYKVSLEILKSIPK